jgi:hypothetical protein
VEGVARDDPGEFGFADQKVGVRLSETLTEKSLSGLNVKE